MYAVIQAGGRQYKVSVGDVIHVDYFDAPEGANVTFDQVLLTGGSDSATKIGRPLVDGASVTGTVKGQERGPKLLIFKRKRRHNYRWLMGFRSRLTAVSIDKIDG